LEATLVNTPWARFGFDFPAILYVFNKLFFLERKHLKHSLKSAILLLKKILLRPARTLYSPWQLKRGASQRKMYMKKEAL
jgi:hypothetical protein